MGRRRGLTLSGCHAKHIRGWGVRITVEIKCVSNVRKSLCLMSLKPLSQMPLEPWNCLWCLSSKREAPPDTSNLVLRVDAHNSLTRCPSEVPHHPWRAITESRTSDALSPKHDGHSNWMSDMDYMRIQNSRATAERSAHNKVIRQRSWCSTWKAALRGPIWKCNL